MTMRKLAALSLILSLATLSFTFFSSPVAMAQTTPIIRAMDYNLHWLDKAVLEYNPIPAPRPGVNQEHVPLRTSYYLVLVPDDPSDRVLPDSVTVSIRAAGENAWTPLLRQNRTYAPGYRGTMKQEDTRYGKGLTVFIDSESTLAPGITYTIRVTARSAKGGHIPEKYGMWSFTTEETDKPHTLTWRLDMQSGPDAFWEGGIKGVTIPSFNTAAWERPLLDLFADARKQFPNAWVQQRDWYLSAFHHRPRLLQTAPNVVREMETRRITRMVRSGAEVVLQVEDFFGHEQYGIPSNRPLSGDYRPGDRVLIADGLNHAHATVLAVDDNASTVTVSAFPDPIGGWAIDYIGPLPNREDPDLPGLFPPGGTYLRKLDPPGTPVYYWGRVYHQWDIVHGEYGMIVMPEFSDAPGDLSLDGQEHTTAKDYRQLHRTVREMTAHLIERYGEATLEWPWVIFNEPDLSGAFWRVEDWNELQIFYDYASDAILRAFEDHGYDSRLIQIGGLELGGILGTNLRLEEFLTHVSPHAENEAIALTHNAACVDPQLDGQRSRRVQELCDEHQNRGAPLDFISIHTYNTSDVAAAKLIKAKETALAIDPDYFENLRVHTHESVPIWTEIQDPGAAEMYLGNGYFSSWAADFVSRLVEQAARDERYGYGGNILLTLWSFFPGNFQSLNGVARAIRVEDRTELVPMQIFHFANLLSTFGPHYWTFPPETIGNHRVSGFASRTDKDWRLMVYAHDTKDTHSRSSREFLLDINITGLEWSSFRVKQYRLDKENNSHYELARQYVEKGASSEQYVFSEEEFREILEMSALKETEIAVYGQDRSDAKENGGVSIPIRLQGNGVSFVIIEPVTALDEVKQWLEKQNGETLSAPLANYLREQVADIERLLQRKKTQEALLNIRRLKFAVELPGLRLLGHIREESAKQLGQLLKECLESGRRLELDTSLKF